MEATDRGWDTSSAEGHKHTTSADKMGGGGYLEKGADGEKKKN